MPFATDMQRGLFLSQLDKEEQKLLDSVDGQKEGDNGKISRDFRLGNPSQPRQVVVKEVKNGSKLASIAKDVLKAYIGIQYILPASVYMLSMKKLCDLIDHGTISLGLTGSVSSLGAGGPTGSVGLVMDASGDVGLITTYGVFAGTPQMNMSAFASISNADNIEDLAGTVFEVGGSGGELVSVGGEVATVVSEDNKLSVAVNLNVGIGIPVPGIPFEFHAGLSTSEVERLFNIFDAWAEFMEGYNEW